MFGSEILEVAIGLFFIFLLLSLVASAIREGIESLMKTRAADLYRGVRELLGSDEALAARLYEHPLVQSLYLDRFEKPKAWRLGAWRTTLPSYIPAPNFALALLDMAARPDGATGGTGGTGTPKLTLESVEASIHAIPNEKVRRVLQIAVDRAEGNLTRAQENLEAWFNSSMDRVSGWYKRRTQYILFGIGLVVAVLANVDTIAVARHLYQNDQARAAIVTRAEVFTATMNASGGAPDTVSTALRKRITGELDSLKAVGIPIGWTRTAPVDTVRPIPAGPPPKRWTFVDGLRAAWWHFVTHGPGWILTAFAVSLGAPFWFDVLNKVMVIRSTVKPNEKSPNEGSEDRQPVGGAKQPKLGGGPETALVGAGTDVGNAAPPASADSQRTTS